MGKLLRVLSVVFLLLSIVALVFGSMLFGKRELLLGRTQLLEKTVIALGPFIENEAAEPEQNTFPAKDTSDCTAEVIENPNKSEFWNTYAKQIEQQDRLTMDIGQRRPELQAYYLPDPITPSKPARDSQGYKVISGKGTMKGLLEEVEKKAADQHQRLNQTRKLLTTVREELVNTIEELNRRKATLRQSLAEIEQKKKNISQLEDTVRTKDQNIKSLEDEKKALTDKVAEKETEITTLNDTIKQKDETIAVQAKKIKALTERDPDPFRGGEGGQLPPVKIDAGAKGTVASVDKEWNFAVLNLTDEFLRELLGPDLTGAMTPVQLMIRRPEQGGKFVTKVRLAQIKRDQKLGIANILLDWQQTEVQPGDIVFF